MSPGREESSLRSEDEEQRFDLALRGAALGLWDLDVRTGEAVVNDRIARLVGGKAGVPELRFEGWETLVHPEDKERVYAVWAAHVRGETDVYEDEYRLRDLAGNWRWVLSRGRIVEREADGTAVRAVGTFFDISERKGAEEALRASEARHRAVVENAPLGILEIDRRGRLVSANQPLLSLLGAPSVEALREEFDAIGGPRLTGAGIATVARRCLEEGEQGTIETRWESRWGRPLDVRIHYAPLRAEGREITGAVAFVEDVTERRHLEAQIQYAQKLESLGVLAGGIAHDFNNLLVAILGNADIVLSDFPPGAEGRRNLEHVVEAAQRAGELCLQMLAYSGRGQVVMEPVDLSAVVREMSDLLEVSVSKRAELRYQLEEGLPAVEADLTPLRQVIMNLITNASDALGEESGGIRVAVGGEHCTEADLAASLLGEGLPEGRYVTLEVSDTGCGMDQETIERIFDPFFTTKFPGRGLGLGAVLGIIRTHRGAIQLESELGRGSTFRVLLPALERSLERPAESTTPADDWRGSGTILVVDDEIRVRRVIARMLVKAGFDVVTAEDGDEAVELFRRRASDIDCVVLDLTMPRMGGEETFRAMREIRSDVPVLLASGYHHRDVAERLADEGFAGFLQKPFQRTALLAQVRELLEG